MDAEEGRGTLQGDAAEGAVHRRDAARPRPADPGRAVLGARPVEYRGDEGRPAGGEEGRQDHPVLNAPHGYSRAPLRLHLPDRPWKGHADRRVARSEVAVRPE